jgi:hypothetical protein
MSTCWHVTSMNYQRTAQRYMDEGITLDIRNVCLLLVLSYINYANRLQVDSYPRP